MQQGDDATAELTHEPPTPSAGWQGRLLITIAGFIIVVVLVLLLAQLSHGLGQQAHGINQLKLEAAGGRPVNEDLIRYYEKLYGLDREGPCIQGDRLAAVCEDGEVMWGGDLWGCAEHGGFKDWVVCR